jgi:TPP-dependent pyruvate/acetoin dehydrogenase alpha subunit
VSNRVGVKTRATGAGRPKHPRSSGKQKRTSANAKGKPSVRAKAPRRAKIPTARKTLLATLYRKIYRIRRAEQAIIQYYGEDQMKTPMHMSMGEEAITAGVCTALTAGDKLFGYYRSHAIYIARTDETDQFFGEMYGKAHGVVGGKGGSMHLAAPEVGLMAVSAIVASTIAPAVGAAFAESFRKTKNVVVSFFGDGAMEEGVFWESLNVACLYKLPIVFVCEDNGLAVDVTAPERQGFRSIRTAVAGFDCEYLASDTTDAEKIHALAAKARATAVNRSRPVFLHLQYYRLLQHIGVKNDFDIDTVPSRVGFEKTGYRSRKEYELGLRYDPVKVARAKLERTGFTAEELLAIERPIDDEVEASVARAKTAPFPTAAELNTHIFAAED